MSVPLSPPATRRSRPASKRAPTAAAVASTARNWLPWAALASLVALWLAYLPALNGQFVFDDLQLPFYKYGDEVPLLGWLKGVRPALMLSYWIDRQVGGRAPFAYHATNLLIHSLNGVLVFWFVRRVIGRAVSEAGRRDLWAGSVAAAFLLHPVQTESVAYVAGRSEALSATFFLGSLLVATSFWGRAISWAGVVGTLFLFALAFLTKEHTAVLPGVLLLTDYWWNAEFTFTGARRNWRLYSALAGGAAVALALVWRLLASAPSAGFGVKEVTWYQYLLTQGQVFWIYARLAVLPYGQTLDYDVPFARSLWDLAALLGWVALIAAAVLAWRRRREYPLASYGLFLFLLLLLPTSSVVPLLDPVAEHRLYLPLVGLLLVLVELVRRWRLATGQVAFAAAVLLVACAVASNARSKVWATEYSLWEDVIRKAPERARGHLQMGSIYYEHGKFDLACREFEAASRIAPLDVTDLVDWAVSAGSLGRYDLVQDKLTQALKLEQSARIYTLFGINYGLQHRTADALDAFQRAIQLDPNYAQAHSSLGDVYALQGEMDKAATEFRRALALNPADDRARQSLAQVEAKSAVQK